MICDDCTRSCHPDIQDADSCKAFSPPKRLFCDCCAYKDTNTPYCSICMTATDMTPSRFLYKGHKPAGEGRKDDNAKPRWDLLPMGLVEETVKVLTFGAKKYADNNWMKVANFNERYWAALMRHLVAWRSGEINDPETGLSHLAHAVCNLVFLHHGSTLTETVSL